MPHAALARSARLICAASVALLPFAAAAQDRQFTDAADCRRQWDEEFDHYLRQYRQCGPECWSTDFQRREYRRFSQWLGSLELWRLHCRAMNGTEQQLKNGSAMWELPPLPAAGPISINTDGQSSCELIRSGEVRYRFHWQERHGRQCYSNTGYRKNVAACCPDRAPPR